MDQHGRVTPVDVHPLAKTVYDIYDWQQHPRSSLPSSTEIMTERSFRVEVRAEHTTPQWPTASRGAHSRFKKHRFLGLRTRICADCRLPTCNLTGKERKRTFAAEFLSKFAMV